MRSFPATAPLLLLLALTLPVGCGPGGNDAGFGLVVPRTELLLPRSTQESLDVAIIREGYERPVRIEALVLPTGVTVEPVDVAGDARDAMLRFQADHNAALGDHTVQILATGPGEPQRRTTIRLTISPGRLVLDTDFGDWGITLVDDIDRDVSAKREHFVCSVIPEPNGEIVVAGTSVARSDTEERWHWFLMWFDARGQHLRTARRSQQLGGAGAPDYMTSRMHSAIRTRAGGYVCVGEATRASPLFARHAVEYFTADGSFDEEFGTLGIVFELPQGTEAGYAAHDVIEIGGPEGPGRFLVVGEAPDPDLGRVMTITRFRADLVRDVSFGSRGTLMYPFRGKASGARRIAALSRDALVVGGWYGVSEQFIELDFALLRLDGDGRPDLSMGIDAELSVDVTPLDHLTDMLTQRGRVLIGGYTGGPARGVLARFDSRGADPTFPNTPIPMPIAPGGGPRYVSTQVAALAQTSHSLYAVGRADTGAQTYALVCRFTQEGVLDPQPGAEGLQVDSLHATDRWQARFDAVAFQRGMLICAGTSDGNVALARYWP